MLSKLRDKLPDQQHRAMWKNFCSAIGLLTIAMVAALYSSSAGRDGRLAGAAIGGLIALIIALWVGIRFVPRLAAGVDWDWLPFLAHYQVTREGWIYFVSVTVVVFAAINTNNNLLYMVLAALMAVLLLSGFLSGLNFKLLRANVRIPATCFAGEPFPISFQIRNEKRVFPSFSLNIEPSQDNPFRYPAFYIPVARAQEPVVQSGQAMLPRRGRYFMKEAKALSRYPFGFFAKEKNVPVDAECVCYPEIIPLEQMNFSVLDVQGSTQRFERGLGNDLYTIRNYMPSDSARHVHWKASAKTAALKTREYAAEESRRIALAFDRFGHPGDIEKFEQLVSYAASLAYHLINDGIEVSLVSDDWNTGFGSSQMLLESILRYLAVVNMQATAERPPMTAADGAVVLSLR
jgi:uncharacterized protein (DUF58 family)